MYGALIAKQTLRFATKATFILLATEALRIEETHCIPGMLYEATMAPRIQEVHCIPGMLYEATKAGRRIE